MLGEAWTRGAKRSEVHAGMGRRIFAATQCWAREPDRTRRLGRHGLAYPLPSLMKVTEVKPSSSARIRQGPRSISLSL